MKQRPDATGVHAHMLLPQTGEPPARLAIDVLGRFDAAIDDEPVAAERWPSLRAAHLVQLLALQPRQRMSRDLAIDALWPQLDPDAGAANLRKALHHGRQALGRHDGITLLGGELVLWPERPVRVDADTFEQQARTALRQHDPVVVSTLEFVLMGAAAAYAAAGDAAAAHACTRARSDVLAAAGRADAASATATPAGSTHDTGAGAAPSTKRARADGNHGPSSQAHSNGNTERAASAGVAPEAAARATPGDDHGSAAAGQGASSSGVGGGNLAEAVVLEGEGAGSVARPVYSVAQLRSLRPSAAVHGSDAGASGAGGGAEEGSGASSGASGAADEPWSGVTFAVVAEQPLQRQRARGKRGRGRGRGGGQHGGKGRSGGKHERAR